MSEIETKKYTITGLVDYMDEQGNIAGQLEVGSVQELPVEIGDAAVADGRAEVYEGEEVAEQTEVGGDEVVGADTTTGQDASGATGEDDADGEDLEEDDDGEDLEEDDDEVE